MNNIIPWLGIAAMAVVIAACGGKVVVDGLGDNSGGASNLTTSTASGSPQKCGDVQIPAPASLLGCSASVGVGGAGASCQTDLCDSAGNIYTSLCQGSTCACQFNGFTKCGCSISGVTNFCTEASPCCPWVPIPL